MLRKTGEIDLSSDIETFILKSRKMFPGALEMWALFAKVKEAGYLPYLLLVPDPNGPLSELMMPPIHSDLHVRHMDQLKTIMARFVIIFQYLQLGILEFSGCVLDGRINSTMG